MLCTNKNSSSVFFNMFNKTSFCVGILTQRIQRSMHRRRCCSCKARDQSSLDQPRYPTRWTGLDPRDTPETRRLGRGIRRRTDSRPFSKRPMDSCNCDLLFQPESAAGSMRHAHCSCPGRWTAGRRPHRTRRNRYIRPFFGHRDPCPHIP